MVRVFGAMGRRLLKGVSGMGVRALLGYGADSATASGSVSAVWIVRESWSESLGVWELVECALFPASVGFDRFGEVVAIVSGWWFSSDHRVQLRDVACDGAVMVLRSVVIAADGGRS